MRNNGNLILFNATLALSMTSAAIAHHHTTVPAFSKIYEYDPNNDGSVALYGRLHTPAGYDPSKSYPLVVFYHGQGSMPNNSVNQVNSIPGLISEANARGFFVYAPQVNAQAWYASSVDASMRVLSQIQKEHNIDPQRIYVTGLSMGGSGTWNALLAYKDVFAAGVPTATGLPNAGASSPHNGLATIGSLVGKPIWMFHAANDTTLNPSGNSRALVNAIRAADGGKSPLSWRLNNNPSNPYYNTGAPYYTTASGTTYYEENNLRYTEYASGGHNSWTPAYNDQNMYDWLLQHKTSLESLSPGKTALFDLGSHVATWADEQGRQWNSGAYQSETTFGTAVPFAMDSTGLRTTVELNIVKKFAGRFTNAGDGAGALYDPSVVLDGWSLGSTAGNAATLANPAEIEIGGLVPGEAYRLVLFASRDGNDGGRGYITRYTVGDEWRDLDVANNLDRTAVFEHLVADTTGRLTLNITVAPGTSRYAHLNVLELTALPEPASLGMLAMIGAGLLSRQRRGATR